jgi:hypothetical protein
MRYRGAIGLAIAGSMIFSSTAAVASAALPATQPDPWAVLSVMNGGASAAAVCGLSAAAATTAAQPTAGCVLPQIDVTPTPPVAQEAPPQPIPTPPVEASAGVGISPMLLGLLALAGAVGLYFALRHHHHHPNSPA